MDNQLFDAILSMDSYNRGYNPGIDLASVLGVPESDAFDSAHPIMIGNAAIIASDGVHDPAALADGFYAIAYQYGSTVTIAYRGTDKFTSGSFDGVDFGGDIYNSYGSGAGLSETPQSILAFAFYKTVAAQAALSGDTVTLTGHSLGGWLAGLNP